MTAEEAVAQAEAEGLTLLRSEANSTGYKFVVYVRDRRHRPFHTQMRRGGAPLWLGSYATAEEAALVVSRTPEGRAALLAAASAPPPKPPPPSLTAEEAVAQAEAEGLTLMRSSSSNSGYRGVHYNAKSAAPKSVQMGSSVRMSSRSGAAPLGRRSTRTFATEGEYPNIAIALNGYAGRNGDVNDRSRPGRSTRRPSDSAPTRTLPADRP